MQKNLYRSKLRAIQRKHAEQLVKLNVAVPIPIISNVPDIQIMGGVSMEAGLKKRAEDAANNGELIDLS